ncbi:MAG: tail fiber domain-containing protein [Vibrio splendidus]
MSVLGDIFDGITGKTAAEASQSAADTSAQYQQQALDYLKQSQEPLLEAQKFGLSGLMDYYGGNQQGVVDAAMESPYYTSMLTQGEEAVLRNAAATGGLRGGNVQSALTTNNQNVLNSAIGQQLGGLQTLSGFQPNTAGVANLTSGIGNTLAQGQLGAAQAEQQGIGNLINLGTSVAGMFSDENLKDDVKKVGIVNGYNWYSWTWNSIAEGLGLKGESQGVLAQEVEKVKPELIGESQGYKTVNYEGIL